jgi:hypothetical protein
MRKTIIALVLMVPFSASASIVTIDWSSTVTSVNSDTDGHWASLGLGVASVITGMFSYDDTATNSDSNSLNADMYPLTGFTSSLPGSTSPNSISATDFGASDSWQAIANLVLPGTNSGFINLLISGGDYFDITDVGLGLGHPIIGPPVLDTPFAGSTFRYEDSFGFGFSSLSATTTFSLPGASVPEPSTVILLLMGLLGLAAAKLRRA